MKALSPESGKDVTARLGEVLGGARYLVDASGGKTDVVLSLEVWKSLLALLEDLDDREVVRNWLPRLKAGPSSAGALRWADVSGEWDDDEAVRPAD
ncbi:MAG TPA: hypothetical protein VGG06_26290 [Thermoanaerobaculia bacterium]|jgi:hypothetical protein